MSLKPQTRILPTSLSVAMVAFLWLLFPATSPAQIVATISNPPTSPSPMVAGNTFAITETIWNPGTSSIGCTSNTVGRCTTTTLSLENASTLATTELRTMPVRQLGGGEISTVSLTDVVIPLQTARGTYYIKACVARYLSSPDCRTSVGSMNIVPPTDFTLTVNFTGNGGGTVLLPDGTPCTSSCSTVVRNGQTVTLTATADNLSSFTGWPDCPGRSSCNVTINSNKTIRADFSRTKFKVRVNVAASGAGRGNVSGGEVGFLPPPIAGCTGDCGTITVNANSDLILVALPEPAAVPRPGGLPPLAPWQPPPSRFTGWTGDCSGLNLTVRLGVNRDITCTANFTFP